MNVLPSKKFGATAVLILAAFAGWFFIFGPGNRPSNPAPTVVNESLISIEQTPSLPSPTEETETPTDTSEEYLRLEGVSFPVSRVLRAEGDSEDPAVLKAYGVALGKALRPYGDAKRQNEVELTLLALEKGSAKNAAKEIASLTAAVQVHTAVQEALEKVHVPESLVYSHAALITAASRLEQLVSNMSTPFEDPVLALASIGEYKAESLALRSTLIAINEEFTKAEITFSDTEKITVVLYEVQ